MTRDEFKEKYMDIKVPVDCEFNDSDGDFFFNIIIKHRDFIFYFVGDGDNYCKTEEREVLLDKIRRHFKEASPNRHHKVVSQVWDAISLFTQLRP
jgi:hypothetical protein